MTGIRSCSSPIARFGLHVKIVQLKTALHGARPFEGSTVLELRGDVLAGRPRPGPLRSRVPRRIQAALVRGLSVDRTRRFADMNTLLEGLGIKLPLERLPQR